MLLLVSVTEVGARGLKCVCLAQIISWACHRSDFKAWQALSGLLVCYKTLASFTYLSVRGPYYLGSGTISDADSLSLYTAGPSSTVGARRAALRCQTMRLPSTVASSSSSANVDDSGPRRTWTTRARAGGRRRAPPIVEVRQEGRQGHTTALEVQAREPGAAQ